ncbi:MAG: hypothetical protein JSV03_00680, partial [Planctomycetota bacterium]
MAQVEKHIGYIVKRRSRHRWLIRIPAALVVVAAIIYASIPLWLPTGWITRKMVEQLSSDLNREVQISNLSIGWGKGVLIENFIIAGCPDWPNDHLVQVAQVRCSFSPIRTLLNKEVEQIELVEPQLWIVLDEDGRFNLHDLINKQHDKPPSLNYKVRKASCHVLTPKANQTFRIDHMTCRLKPTTGMLELSGDAQISRQPESVPQSSTGKFHVDADITVPRLKREVTLGGNIHVEWTDLSLTDLPLPLIPHLPVQQVAGSTTGRLTLSTQPDLGIDYQLAIIFDGVKITREGLDQPADVPDAQVSCQGHWDPNNDILLMRDFEYQTNALHVYRTTMPVKAAMVINRNDKIPFQLNLEGRIKDWPALRREFPEVDTFARSINAEVSGGADFALSMTQALDEDLFTVSVDGRQSKWIISGNGVDYLSADAGVPKRFNIEIIRNRHTRQISQPELSMTVGDLSLSANSKLVVPEPEAADIWQWFDNALSTLQCEIDVKSNHIENMVALLPFLTELTDVKDWRGPLQINASIVPNQSASKLDLTMT